MHRLFQRLLQQTRGLRAQALVVLCLFGYLASFEHDLSVQHTLCAAHGVWEHATTTVPDPGCRPAADKAAPELRAAPAPTAEQHEHCSIVIAVRGEHWLVPQASLALTGPVLEAARDEFVDAVPLRELQIRATPARGPPTNG